MIEKTLVLLKPDAVSRGLVGNILRRFERVGLKIIGVKLVQATADQLNRHYPSSRREFIEAMGQKTLDNNRSAGVDTQSVMGTDDAYELGLKIQQWNVASLQSGPIWALVLEGPSAIALVRKLRGPTLPINAEPGTINGDYSFDSANLANPQQRSLRNLVHASGNAEEAELEIDIWFDEAELHPVKSIQQDFMLS